MKTLLPVICLLFSTVVQAHHSKDHLMLLEDTDQVISTTQHGVGGGLFWLLWTAVFILLLLGFVRWLKKRL